MPGKVTAQHQSALLYSPAAYAPMSDLLALIRAKQEGLITLAEFELEKSKLQQNATSQQQPTQKPPTPEPHQMKRDSLQGRIVADLNAGQLQGEAEIVAELEARRALCMSATADSATKSNESSPLRDTLEAELEAELETRRSAIMVVGTSRGTEANPPSPLEKEINAQLEQRLVPLRRGLQLTVETRAAIGEKRGSIPSSPMQEEIVAELEQLSTEKQRIELELEARLTPLRESQLTTNVSPQQIESELEARLTPMRKASTITSLSPQQGLVEQM